MRRLLQMGIGLSVALVASLGAQRGEARLRPAPDPLGPEPVTVVIDVEHSTFSPAAIAVERGTRVRFVVVNDDPINHEFIVGPPSVHDRHRSGTEKTHPAVAGEVSVPALSRGVTSYVFDTAGSVEFACHLPGHLEYGMRGSVEVGG